MKNDMRDTFKTLFALTLVLAVFVTDVPFGLLEDEFKATRDHNGADDVQGKGQVISLEDLLQFETAHAGPLATPAVYQATFAAKGSTGAQAITGLGFQPSAIIFFW